MGEKKDSLLQLISTFLMPCTSFHTHYDTCVGLNIFIWREVDFPGPIDSLRTLKD